MRIGSRYCSQAVGDRKKILLPGGSRLSLNSPSPQFAPVKFWRSHSDRRHFYAAGVFAAQDANADGCNLLTDLEHGHVRTADDPLAEESIGITENGGIRDGVKSLQGLAFLMHNASGVDNHQLPENRRLWWQVCRMFQNLFERQRVVPCELDAIFERFGLLLDFLPPECLDRRAADNAGDVICVR